MKTDNLPEKPDAARSFVTGVSAGIVTWTVDMLRFPARIFPWAEALINLPLRLIQGVAALLSRKPSRAEALTAIQTAIEADPMLRSMPYVIVMVEDRANKIPLPWSIMAKYSLLSGDIVHKDLAKEILETAIAWSKARNSDEKADIIIARLG